MLEYVGWLPANENSLSALDDKTIEAGVIRRMGSLCVNEWADPFALKCVDWRRFDRWAEVGVPDGEDTTVGRGVCTSGRNLSPRDTQSGQIFVVEGVVMGGACSLTQMTMVVVA